ncbi:MAG: Sec-independent protein translocase protein TatB [Betaproteobacteria bacterium]
MFDIGFSELAVVGVVALVVLGPERLPKVARTAGHLFGRLQRYVATVKADLNREMEFSELAKVKQEVQEAARAFEKSTQDHVQSVESEARNISASLEKLPADAAADIAPATQMQMLAAQEEGLTGKSDAVALAEAESSVTPAAVPSIQTPPARVTAPAIAIERGMLDFGIEPVRTSRA